MELATREKWLIGAALGVASIVYFMAPTASTVEPVAVRAMPARIAKLPIGPRGARAPLAELAHRVASDAAAGALFAAHSWYTPPPPPPPAAKPIAIVRAPVVPTAPPLPYTYMGSYVRDGGRPVFFLTRGDRTYDVKIGDMLDGVYRFEGLSGNALVFTYVPLGIRQTLSVNGAQ